MKFGLDDEVIEKINTVFSKYLVIDVVLIYGSRAKGTFTSGSDIDLTLKGKNIDYSTVRNVEMEIDDLLLPYSFDISNLTDISNPDLVDHINRVGQVFYEK